MHQGIKIIKLIGCSSVVEFWSRYRQNIQTYRKLWIPSLALRGGAIARDVV